MHTYYTIDEYNTYSRYYVTADILTSSLFGLPQIKNLPIKFNKKYDK